VSVTNTTPAPTFTINDPFSGGVAGLPPPGGFYRDPYMRTPYLQQFTFGIQRELPWQMVADVNFQDQNSKKLESSWNLNQPPPGPGAVAGRRPFAELGPSIGGTFHEGKSRYDALEMSVRKSSAHYTFQWSHTWAKNLSRSVVDPYNRDLFYGPTGYVPHLDKLHFIVDLPFGRGRRWLNAGGIANQILGGWTLSGFATLYQSGSPLNITWNGDIANIGGGGARPQRIKDGRIDNPTMSQWFDTSAFIAPLPFTFGNAGTGIIFGPSRQAFDAAINKNFPIRENVRIQFRTELFNAFNHPNWANPNTTANGLSFGQILTKSQDPRVIQFAMRLEF
jgi:hypothetical protein